MLSRTLRRALLDSRSPLPPTFLLPWTAGLTTVSHSTPSEPPAIQTLPSTRNKPGSPKPPKNFQYGEIQQRDGLQLHPRQSLPTQEPLHVSTSIRELLPLLRSQTPHYISLHIHGKPYLVTEGDTLRLPFLMHGVEPGDVLRLNRALNVGSRDFTLKAGASSTPLRSATRSFGQQPTTEITPSPPPTQAEVETTSSSPAVAPHFIPHIAQGKHGYVDERFYECRAVVLGTESEPLRIKEKTKRRQRHVRRIKSKHRFTILKIKELRVRSLEEVEAEAEAGAGIRAAGEVEVEV